MSKLIVTEFLSLDGVMEAPGGEHGYAHTGWVFKFQSDDQGQYKFQETMSADALLLGRVTYEGFAAAWPQRSGEFADKFNAMPKYVVSTTLEGDLEWNNSTLVGGDVPQAVERLKREHDEIQVHGSRRLAQTLMREGLVDEYHLMYFPVILGSGARLFPESPDMTMLDLVATQAFESGVVVHTYRPAS